MTDPSPAQQIRNLMDRISDLIEASIPAGTVQRLNDAPAVSTEPRMPLHHDIIDARANLKQILASWALLIVEESGTRYDSTDTTTGIAAWIYNQADWLANHPAYADFITEVEDEVHELARIINRGVSGRKFCGWDNGQPVFTQDSGRLNGDATVQAIANGRAELAVMILDEDMTAKDCALALSELHDKKITSRQILKLYEVDRRRRENGAIGEYEGLAPVRVEWYGKRQQPIFRVGEVLNRVQESARHAGQSAS